MNATNAINFFEHMDQTIKHKTLLALIILVDNYVKNFFFYFLLTCTFDVLVIILNSKYLRYFINKTIVGFS